VKLGRAVALATAASVALPGGAAAAQRLHLVLPLKADEVGLTRFAAAVNNPASLMYGQYESIASLSRRFGASVATRRRVVNYMRAHGASDVSADATGQFVDANIGIVDAQRLFGTRLTEQRSPSDDLFASDDRSPGDHGRGPHADAARFIAPATTVRLPRALKGSVTGVVGLNTAPIATDELQPSSGYVGPDPSATPSGCAAGIAEGGFTPNEYLDAYDYTPLQEAGLLGQGERVALIEVDGFKVSDLRRFASCFHLDTPQINPFGVDVPRPLAPGGEATLDLEVLDAAAPDLKSINVYETTPDAADVLQAIEQPLQGAGFKPQVISVSLGFCEGYAQSGAGAAAIAASETAFKVAAAAGISVLGASGDFGSSDCAASESRPSAPSAPLAVLAVNYPSSSPWVTSVGGTNFTLNAENQITNQSVWNDAAVSPGNAGGGGVSKLFARPPWQDGTVVSKWRAQPDVAMLADVAPGYSVYCTASVDCNGRGWERFGGTSAATPLLAGGFALIDELLRRHEKTPLGFADPLLYNLGRNPDTAAQAFFDVTRGSNDVGPFIQQDHQPLGCCNAQPGYDQASGWGGVNLEGLSQAALTARPDLANVHMRLPVQRHPYKNDGIAAIVSCSRGCDMAAYATVTVAGAQTFTAYSAMVHLVHKNTRQVEILFTPKQLQEIGTALMAHQAVSAEVTGAIVDAGGNIERRSTPLLLVITS
jgi:subtilase family serine protease